MKKEVSVADYIELKDELTFILDNNNKEEREVSKEHIETMKSVIGLLDWGVVSSRQDYVDTLEDIFSTGIFEEYDHMLLRKAKVALYTLANDMDSVIESIGLYGCYNLGVECSHLESSRDETDQTSNRFLYSLTDVERMYQNLYTIFDSVPMDNTEAIEIVRVAYNRRAHSRYIKSLCALNNCESNELEAKLSDTMVKGLNKMVEPYILSPIEKFFMEEVMNDDTLLTKLEELVNSGIMYLKPNGFPLLVKHDEDGELQTGEDIAIWFNRINGKIVEEIEKMSSIGISNDIITILEEYNLPTIEELSPIVIEQLNSAKFRKEITPGKILVTYYASLFGKTLKEFSSKNLSKLCDRNARQEFFNMEDKKVVSIIEELTNGNVHKEVINYMTLVITILGGFILKDESLTKDII